MELGEALCLLVFACEGKPLQIEVQTPMAAQSDIVRERSLWVPA
jgi:hypothetical protein